MYPNGDPFPVPFSVPVFPTDRGSVGWKLPMASDGQQGAWNSGRRRIPADCSHTGRLPCRRPSRWTGLAAGTAGTKAGGTSASVLQQRRPRLFVWNGSPAIPGSVFCLGLVVHSNSVCRDRWGIGCCSRTIPCVPVSQGYRHIPNPGADDKNHGCDLRLDPAVSYFIGHGKAMAFLFFPEGASGHIDRHLGAELRLLLSKPN